MSAQIVSKKPDDKNPADEYAMRPAVTAKVALAPQSAIDQMYCYYGADRV